MEMKTYPCGCQAGPADDVPAYCYEHSDPAETIRPMLEIEYRITKTGTALVSDKSRITRDSLIGVIPEGARVEAINDRAFLSYCEGCGVAICEGAEYFTDSDGIYTCIDCHE